MQNVNLVVITGNLTRDPELRHTGGGTAITEMRVAVNSRRKNSQTGEWEDKVNFVDVVVFGSRAVAVAEYLSKGLPVAVEGRLDWQQWEAKDGSGTRQALKIIAGHVQFLRSGKPSESEAPSPASEEAEHEAACEGSEQEPVSEESEMEMAVAA